MYLITNTSYKKSMINHIYQLVSPRTISPKYQEIEMDNKVIVQPMYMSICHADQRYYFGERDANVLKRKLPMSLIHECCGNVLYDPKHRFQKNDKVVLIPNVAGKEDNVIAENYRKDSKFLSSGFDGFMREMVDLPARQLVKFDQIPWQLAAITEFVSVAVHACSRFLNYAHKSRKKIGIWGDGSLAYVMANVLKSMLPDCEIVVIGKNSNKLELFSFVEYTYFTGSLPEDLELDHAFECVGGEGSVYAIDEIIERIAPQGSMILMGVSENKIPIFTRNVLEKGITLIGCSRSGREDFEMAVKLMSSKKFQDRLSVIIEEEEAVCSIEDIHRVFQKDRVINFKTVFKWNL